MAEIKVEASIADVLGQLEGLCTDIETVKTQASSMSIGAWQGSSANSFKDLLVLTQQYHDDVLFLIESLKQHVSTLKGDIDGFADISTRMANLKAAI
jgi:uncharacterized protein YukE